MVTAAAEEMSGNIQSAVAFGIALIFTIIYVWSFCLKRETAPTQHNIKSIVVIICIIYVCSYTLRYCGKVTVIIIGEENVDPTLHEVLDYLVFDLPFAIGHICFNLLMILRLQTGFNGTIYETPKQKLFIFYTLLLSIFITDELYFIIDQNKNKKGSIFYHDTSTSRFGAHTYLFLVVVILNCLLGTILIREFNRNIWNLIQMRQATNQREITITTRSTPIDAEVDASSNSDGTGVSRTDLGQLDTVNSVQVIASKIDMDAKRFLDIAIRYTLLCSIPIIVTNVQFSGWILLQFQMIKNESSINWFIIIWDWLFDLVLFTNFFCIWLSFPFGKHVYHKKCICGHYHDKCKNCCTFLVGFKIFSQDIKAQKEQVKQSIELA